MLICFLDINSREERNKLFFDDEPFNMSNKTSSTDYWLSESANEPNSSFWPNKQKQDSVLLQLDDTEQEVRIAVEREQEVEHIVQSISELHSVFKVHLYYKNF